MNSESDEITMHADLATQEKYIYIFIETKNFKLYN